MAIAENYSREVLTHLSAIPVWEPGTVVTPGRIGRLRDGVFYDEGGLGELWPEAPLEVDARSGSDERYFASGDVRQLEGEAEAGVPGTPVGVRAQLSFQRGGACVLHASECRVSALSRLREVLQHMDGNRDTFREVVVVSHVETAARFRVLCSETNDWTVEIGGDAAAVRGLRIADSSVSVASRSGAGYQASGSGPLLLRLYGIRRRWMRGERVEPLEALRRTRGPSPSPEEPVVREIRPEELLP